MCFIAAPATVPLINATAVSGGAGTGLFGTGLLAGGIGGLGVKGTNILLSQLALGGTQQVIAARKANQQAQFFGKQAVQQAEAADSAFAIEQEGLGARLKEERKANAQEQLALARQGAQAAGAVRASERAGLTIDMLLGDVERQTGEASNLLNQTLASTVQQYRRNTLGLDAKRKRRRVEAENTRNQALGMRRGPLDVALSTLGSGISSYYGLRGQA